MDGIRVVAPLGPPMSCKPGDRVEFEGYEHGQHGGMY